MIVAEKFIRSLVSNYGKLIVYTDGGSWYDEQAYTEVETLSTFTT